MGTKHKTRVTDSIFGCLQKQLIQINNTYYSYDYYISIYVRTLYNSLSNTGSIYAAVFPVPVAAHPHMSLPPRAIGIAAA